VTKEKGASEALNWKLVAEELVARNVVSKFQLETESKKDSGSSQKRKCE